MRSVNSSVTVRSAVANLLSGRLGSMVAGMGSVFVAVWSLGLDEWAQVTTFLSLCYISIIPSIGYQSALIDAWNKKESTTVAIVCGFFCFSSSLVVIFLASISYPTLGYVVLTAAVLNISFSIAGAYFVSQCFVSEQSVELSRIWLFSSLTKFAIVAILAKTGVLSAPIFIFVNVLEQGLITGCSSRLVDARWSQRYGNFRLALGVFKHATRLFKKTINISIGGIPFMIAFGLPPLLMSGATNSTYVGWWGVISQCSNAVKSIATVFQGVIQNKTSRFLLSEGSNLVENAGFARPVFGLICAFVILAALSGLIAYYISIPPWLFIPLWLVCVYCLSLPISAIQTANDKTFISVQSTFVFFLIALAGYALFNDVILIVYWLYITYVIAFIFRLATLYMFCESTKVFFGAKSFIAIGAFILITLIIGFR